MEFIKATFRPRRHREPRIFYSDGAEGDNAPLFWPEDVRTPILKKQRQDDIVHFCSLLSPGAQWAPGEEVLSRGAAFSVMI